MAKKIEQIKVEEVKIEGKVEEVQEVKKNVKKEKINKIDEKEVLNMKDAEKAIESAGITEEAKKEEKKEKVGIMTEEFMKEIHANYNGSPSKMVKEYVDEQGLENLKNGTELEFVMLTQESRKIYYLIENNGSEPKFIGTYKSIMEVKIFIMKLSALLGKEHKVHYFKPGRKNQSSEKISGKTYFDKIEKYQNI